MKESVVTTGRLGDSVAVATLVREKPLNSLLLDTIDQLAEFVDEALADPAISCLLLQSSTPRAFCAGADITALYRAIRGEEGLALSYAEAFFLREYMLDYRLHRSAKPVIAWGEGIVMGGGLGLLGGCSHRVGTASTRI
ncbi:MAG: enoyl-CoA hydratase/isomerase family protein, partial [Proteobacteria bacterium]|nr:enoyl-CoA hydratase/isomerase family protein [Pseudomonadota bacterium]